MQVQNNKEEVPFAHYEEKFASLDPQEAAARCGVPFENGRFTVTLLGTAYQIAWPKYAISSEDEAAFALKSLPCQTFLLRFLLEGYDGLAVLTTLSAADGVVRLRLLDCGFVETMRLLDSIAGELCKKSEVVL